MKVLITGANGLLGQKLTDVLDRDESVELVATGRRPLGFSLKRGMSMTLDVTNSQEVEKVVADVRPDTIIHTAAMTQVDQCETEREACWLNNVTAVEYLAASCGRHNIHLIHLSTDFIFDGKEGPLDENAAPHPLSYYGESKLASEEVIRKNLSRWAILRTVLVYGVTRDMSRSNIVLWVKKSLEEKKPIKVVSDQWRTPTLAEDLAKGCILAMKKQAQGVFHISGKDMMTPYDIAIATAEHFGLDKSLITKTDSNDFKQTAVRPLKTGFVIEKARRELGYEPVSFSEGLFVVEGQLRALKGGR